jgi:hypothetical protein
VKIVERLTNGESKKKREIRVMRPLIVVEVGGNSTFVTHDVIKVEVRCAETHLKLKSHAPKERGRLTLWTSAGLSAAQGQHGPWQAWAWPWFRNFFINFFGIFGFPYVLHFIFGVSCFAHVLV